MLFLSPYILLSGPIFALHLKFASHMLSPIFDMTWLAGLYYLSYTINMTLLITMLRLVPAKLREDSVFNLDRFHKPYFVVDVLISDSA